MADLLLLLAWLTTARDADITEIIFIHLAWSTRGKRRPPSMWHCGPSRTRLCRCGSGLGGGLSVFFNFFYNLYNLNFYFHFYFICFLWSEGQKLCPSGQGFLLLHFSG